MVRVSVGKDTMEKNPGIDPRVLSILEEQRQELERLGVTTEDDYRLEPALGGHIVRHPTRPAPPTSNQLNLNAPGGLEEENE